MLKREDLGFFNTVGGDGRYTKVFYVGHIAIRALWLLCENAALLPCDCRPTPLFSVQVENQKIGPESPWDGSGESRVVSFGGTPMAPLSRDWKECPWA